LPPYGSGDGRSMLINFLHSPANSSNSFDGTAG
jgi:hypothetical protein